MMRAVSSVAAIRVYKSAEECRAADIMIIVLAVTVLGIPL
jgi:hypothetical protein